MTKEQNKIKFTKEELEAIRYALKFYVYDVTHDPDSVCYGLPEGKEKELLKSVMIKIEELK